MAKQTWRENGHKEEEEEEKREKKYLRDQRTHERKVNFISLVSISV